MKYYKTYILAIGLVSLIIACTKSGETIDYSNGQLTLKVNMPSKDFTRVGVAQKEEGLDLIPFWVSGDKMRFYAVQSKDVIPQDGEVVQPRKNVLDLGFFEATNISDDERSCEFKIEYPEEFDRWSPFQLIGVYGKNTRVVDERVAVDASLIRTTLPGFQAPLFLNVIIDGSSSEATCRHFGVYEVVHIKNTGNKDISFELSDYQVWRRWFANLATFYPEYSTYATRESLVEVTGYDVKPIVRVKPGEKASLISWYVKTNEKFEDVKMEAFIDGEYVCSSNTKSTQLSFVEGNAYHIYVTWNGKELLFGESEDLINELGFEPAELELVEGGGYGYESTGREKFYVFDSSNPSVATAVINEDFGEPFVEIEGHNIGDAVVAIIDKVTGLKSQIKVTVKERTVYAAFPEVGKTDEVVMKNENGIYEAYSEDTSIATCIVNGNKIIVTGVKLGNTIIHVTEKTSGKKYIIEVYVNEQGGLPNDGTPGGVAVNDINGEDL